MFSLIVLQAAFHFSDPGDILFLKDLEAYVELRKRKMHALVEAVVHDAVFKERQRNLARNQGIMPYFRTRQAFTPLDQQPRGYPQDLLTGLYPDIRKRGLR